MRRYRSITAVLAAVLFIGVLDGARAEIMERVGYAYDKKTGKFLYSETHREVRENGRLVRDTVTYRDADGKVFAEKQIDFQRSLVMPDFQLVNAGNGHVEGVLASDEQLKIHFRPLSDATVQEAFLEMPQNGIVDAGFDRFIEMYWETLVNGEILERQFLIPSALDFYTFNIEKTNGQLDGELVFELRIKSMFLQMFVSPIEVAYDAKTRSLLRYEGISNIRDNLGENYDVRIEFPQSGRVQVKAPAEELKSGRAATDLL